MTVKPKWKINFNSFSPRSFAWIDRLDRQVIYSLTRTMIDNGTGRTIEGIND